MMTLLLKPFGRQNAAQRLSLFGLFAVACVVLAEMPSLVSVIGLSVAKTEIVQISLLMLIFAASLVLSRNFGRGMSIAYRTTVLWIMVAWLIRLLDIGFTYHIGGVLSDIRFARANPVVDELFPSVFRSQVVVVLGFGLPVITGVATLIWDSMRAFRINALTLLVCSAAMMLHQLGIANQMFTTAFWVSLWLLWLSTRCSEVNDDLSASELLRGAFLAQCIVSFIFLGGFVGKCTAGYWSGETFTNLNFPVYVWFRRLVVDYPWLATLYGRTATIAEGIAALLVLVSPRFALPLSLFVVIGMLVTSAWNIIEALGPVVGLACGGIFLMQEMRRRSFLSDQAKTPINGSR